MCGVGTWEAGMGGMWVPRTLAARLLPVAPVDVKLAAPPPATFTLTAPHAVNVKLDPRGRASFTKTKRPPLDAPADLRERAQAAPAPRGPIDG